MFYLWKKICTSRVNLWLTVVLPDMVDKTMYQHGWHLFVLFYCISIGCFKHFMNFSSGAIPFISPCVLFHSYMNWQMIRISPFHLSYQSILLPVEIQLWLSCCMLLLYLVLAGNLWVSVCPLYSIESKIIFEFIRCKFSTTIICITFIGLP